LMLLIQLILRWQKPAASAIESPPARATHAPVAIKIIASRLLMRLALIHAPPPRLASS
jgi:hypothetical protein